jgi:hypothetical protein
MYGSAPKGAGLHDRAVGAGRSSEVVCVRRITYHGRQEACRQDVCKGWMQHDEIMSAVRRVVRGDGMQGGRRKEVVGGGRR